MLGNTSTADIFLLKLLDERFDIVMIRMIEAEDNKSGIYSMTGLRNKADVYSWYTMHYGQNKRHFEKWFDVARKSGAIKQFNTRLMPYKYYLYPDEILGVLEYDGTPFGSKEEAYSESINRSNRRRSKRVNEKLRPDVDNKRYYDAIEEFKALPFSYEAITKLCNKDIGEVEDIIEMLENSSNANDFNYFQDKYKFAYEAYHKLSSIEDQLLELHRAYVDIEHDIMRGI